MLIRSIGFAAISRHGSIRWGCTPRAAQRTRSESYGFTEADMDRPIFIDNVLGRETATLREICTCARRTAAISAWSSCTFRTGAEILDPAPRRGRALAHRVRRRRKTHHPAQLTEAEAFEAFCQKRYVTTKRFGLEGGEVTIPALHAIIETAADG